MDRKRLLGKAFQRGHLLTTRNKHYKDWINKFIIDETKGDIGSGDITWIESIQKMASKNKPIIFE